MRVDPNLLTTSSSNTTSTLTLGQLAKVIRELKNQNFVSEIRVRNPRFLIDIIKAKPVALVTELHGIPIYSDHRIPPKKAQLIFNDGRVEWIDL